MCGIAGVIAWNQRYRTTRETLSRMSTAIAHRGPDGEGIWFNHDDEVSRERPQCAMVFRRLAILDTDPRAMQPFSIGSKTIVFNGEIYNFRELRAELRQRRPEYQWRTSGDTEVLLLAFDSWGEASVEKLNGMFAFAVWDEAKRSLFLARDRMGQKPLFITGISCGEAFAPSELRQDQYGTFDAIAFASEPAALLALPWCNHTISPFVIEEYLRFGCCPGSIYDAIGEVSPGEQRTFTGNSATQRSYFRVDGSPPTPVDDVTAASSTRRLVTQAVQRQLVSDVPLGIFLSGGIDSSIVAATARQAGPVQTFSIAFDDVRYDESKYAAAVARHLGTKHETFHVTPRAAVDLPKLAAVFGTPFGDSSALPTHYLSRETRRFVTVALSGDGGDELFGGYDRYRAMKLAARLRPIAAVGQLARLAREGHRKSKITRLRRFMLSLDQPAGDRYESYLRIFDDPTIDALLLRRVEPMPACARGRLFDRLAADRDDVQAARLSDWMTYLPDDLLTKVDRASMFHGLEVRSPFMDNDLVEFCRGLTTDQLLRGGGKRMLREAFAADLPDFVFKRKKMGFAVPIGEWFRGELRSMLRDNLFAAGSFARSHFHMAVVERLIDEHEQQRVDHSQRLYVLLMLELWWQRQRNGCTR